MIQGFLGYKKHKNPKFSWLFGLLACQGGKSK